MIEKDKNMETYRIGSRVLCMKKTDTRIQFLGEITLVGSIENEEFTRILLDNGDAVSAKDWYYKSSTQ